ncbi:MAG: DUF1599 domain-containing protein [Chitinophagaceae bacterium]|jgi:hypothetical protein|nr:MAG: DUF1599 domain-containing protein [Chitinophagaceae bacterium]
MVEDTNAQFDHIIAACKDVFLKKSQDYGTSWRVLRPISITDQIMIKALRIRHIQETGSQKIADKTEDEFRGIINYGIIALIQQTLPADDDWELNVEDVEIYYDEKVNEVRHLMQNKNHDYGEAWRQMSEESLVDMILSKLQRIRQILKNKGKTLVSEGIEANVMDIINYAVFALILEEEKK